MKKTLILLCSLAAAAQAADVTLSYTSGTWTADGAAITATELDGATSLKASGYTTSFYLPDINVGNGNTWTFTLNFTVSSDVTIDSVNVAFLTANGSNATQYSDRLGTDTLTLSGASMTDISVTKDVTYKGDASANAAAYDINTAGDPSDGAGKSVTSALGQVLTQTAGETYSLSIQATKGAETNGYFVGIGAIQFNEVVAPTPAVPEPATATLSLLALAGLAARRRRK